MKIDDLPIYDRRVWGRAEIRRMSKLCKLDNAEILQYISNFYEGDDKFKLLEEADLEKEGARLMMIAYLKRKGKINCLGEIITGKVYKNNNGIIKENK